MRVGYTAAPSEVTNARYRSHCPQQALHVRRHGDADRHLRRRRRRSGPQSTSSRTSAFRSSPSFGLTTDCLPTICQNASFTTTSGRSAPKSTTSSISSPSRCPGMAWSRSSSSAASTSTPRSPDDGGLADRSEISAAGNYAALRAQLQRLERPCHSTGAVERHGSRRSNSGRGAEFHPPSIGPGRGLGDSLALRRQNSPGPGRHRPGQAGSLRTIGARTW